VNQTLLAPARRPQLVGVVIGVVALVLVFQATFDYLYGQWRDREEYSHGFLIPLVSAFLLWQRREELKGVAWRGSWSGVAVTLLGLAIYFLGSLASITTLDAYAFVIVLAGCVLAAFGWQVFKVALVPIAMLLLMNPIPNYFYNSLSSELQLISSQIGVAIIRLFGVSVFLEGNVIDLGTYKLQVAEACSGLRYLFPLMTLGVIVGYLFRGRTWMRWCLFLSTIPITVLMNSFRIGVIGVLVDRFGIEQAEGFLHEFEGWVVFMTCLLLLFAECWLLAWAAGERRSLRNLFALQARPAGKTVAASGPPRLGKPGLAVLLLLLISVYPGRALPQRAEIHPTRDDFSEFPLQIGSWWGHRDRLESIYLDALKLDDYLLANYLARGSGGPPAIVNLYVAYYASQRNGQSAHSPRSCLPGGGWRIEEFGQREVAGVSDNAGPLRVNRAIVQQGSSREVVYYWFQERGRDLTNEYLVKWYLFSDALLRNRTDGALVRVTTSIGDNEPIAAADARIAQFTATAMPTLQRFLPN
jgi:exosortase D (VPLPA-CTERM-specific)